MCLCMLMHGTMNHGEHQPTMVPIATTGAASEGPFPARPDALALFDERYARGDIDRQEYLHRREDLTR